MLDIENEIVIQSDFKLKGLFQDSNFRSRTIIQEAIAQDDLSNSGIAGMINATLTIWNDSISIWTERFWLKLADAQIPYSRKDPLVFVLHNGKFKSQGHAQDAKYNWDVLISSGLLRDRFSNEELSFISCVIGEDEQRRLKMLRRCLKTGRVPISSYRQFGENIAYFTRNRLLADYAYRGTLITSHFSEEEIQALDVAWQVQAV